MTNKKQGNAFEREFCEILASNGFWVLNVPQNAAGQPADVVAVRRKTAYLIDCKNCEHSKFPISRIEMNQELSMRLWQECENGEGWFALHCEDRIFMLSYPKIKWIQALKMKNVLSYEDIRTYGLRLEDWVKLA